MNKDNFNRDKPDLIYGPILVAPTISVTMGGESDLAGFESATVYVQYGASADTLDGSNNFYCELWETDTSGASETKVADTDVISSDGTVINKFAFANAEADEDSIFSIGYIGNKQFLSVRGVKTGTLTAGINISVFVMKSHASLQSTGQVTQST